MVLGLKYEKKFFYVALFARYMCERMREDAFLKEGEWLLVSIPQTFARFWKRGYNQSEEIARELARLSGHRFAPVLARRGRTISLTTLNRRERLRANRRSMIVRRRYQGRPEWERARFLLIDDVFTTGSTADVAARALKRAYPRAEVAVLTFLRA